MPTSSFVDLSSDDQYAAWLRKVAAIPTARELRVTFFELALFIFQRNRGSEERCVRCAAALFDRALEDDLVGEGRALILDLHQKTIIVSLVWRRIDGLGVTPALRSYLAELFTSGERATS